MWHSHGLVNNSESHSSIFHCPSDQVKSLKWVKALPPFIPSVCVQIYVLLGGHRSQTEWEFRSSLASLFPQNGADCVYLQLRLCGELWSALVGWRHSVQPSEPLFSCLFISKVDEDEQIWNLRLESWANTFLEAPGSGLVLWTGFFVGLPSPTALVLRAIVFLIPQILCMLNLLRISQVQESV